MKKKLIWISTASVCIALTVWFCVASSGCTAAKAMIGFADAIQTIACNRVDIICEDNDSQKCKDFQAACKIIDMTVEDARALETEVELYEAELKGK